MDHKHNQYLIEQNKHNGMTNREALKVFWGGLLVLAAIASLFILPSLMVVPK